jgi:hypothetical protein
MGEVFELEGVHMINRKVCGNFTMIVLLMVLSYNLITLRKMLE